MRGENIDSKPDMGPEDIVVRAVVNYFDTPRFKRFSIEKEYPIQIGSYRMRADVALIDKAKLPAAIVECKRSGYEGDGQDQLESYLNATGTQLGVFANETDPDTWRFYKNRGKGHFDEIDRSRFESQLNGNVIKRLGRFLQSLLPNPPEPDEPPAPPPVGPNSSHILHIPGAPSVQNDNNTDLDPSLNSEPYYSEQNGFFWARAHRGLLSLLPQHIERIIYGSVQNDHTHSYDERKRSLEAELEQVNAEQKTCEDKLAEKKQKKVEMDREQARLAIEIDALPDKDAPTDPEVHRGGWSIFNKLIAIGMTVVLLTLVFYLFIFYASACDKAFFFDATKIRGISDIVNPFAISDALTGRWNFFVILCPIVFLSTALALHYFWEKGSWLGIAVIGIVILSLDVLLALRISGNIKRGEVITGIESGLDELSIPLIILFGFGVAILCSVIYHIFWHQWKDILNLTEDTVAERRREQEHRREVRVEKESQRATNAIIQQNLKQEIDEIDEELSAIGRRRDLIREHIETLLGRGNVRMINHRLLRLQVNEFLAGWCHYVVHHGGAADEVAQINKTVEATIDRFYEAHGSKNSGANSVQEVR